jgi:uncharacterized protein (TIGR00369 family)
VTEPRFPDPGTEARVRASFAAQAFMRTLGAELGEVRPGEVVIELEPTPALCQQDGFVHAGVVTSIVDSACGYAAYTLMPEGSGVLSVEFKVNLLAPAVGSRLVARGRVVRAGRVTITVCQGDVYARGGAGERHVATMVATMIRVAPSAARDG